MCIRDRSIAEVGAIQKVVNWPDVEDPATLKSLAQKELDNSVNSDLSVSVSAVDEVMTGVNVEAFDIGLLATVEIEPLGIERELLITSITNYLSEPEKDTYTLGKAPSTSTSYTSGGSTGSSGGSDGEALEDTGWNTATVASGFRAYNGTTSNTPQYLSLIHISCGILFQWVFHVRKRVDGILECLFRSISTCRKLRSHRCV